jgi:hypothetical protein
MCVAWFQPGELWMNMKPTSEVRRGAAEPRLKAKMRRKPQMRKAKHAVPNDLANKSSGNAQRNYERYVALANAAGLKGDQIAAENYFQHAEHYLRSMHENSAAAPSLAARGRQQP